VGLVGKKTASVYTCGRMVCDHAGGAGTERREFAKWVSHALPL